MRKKKSIKSSEYFFLLMSTIILLPNISSQYCVNSPLKSQLENILLIKNTLKEKKNIINVDYGLISELDNKVWIILSQGLGNNNNGTELLIIDMPKYTKKISHYQQNKLINWIRKFPIEGSAWTQKMNEIEKKFKCIYWKEKVAEQKSTIFGIRNMEMEYMVPLFEELELEIDAYYNSYWMVQSSFMYYPFMDISKEKML